MEASVKSSPTGAFWHIIVNGQIVEGAPKRGHGSATKAQMVEWANEITKEMNR